MSLNQKILDSMPEEVIVLNPKDRSIVLANRRFCESYGIRAKDAIGRKVCNYFHKEGEHFQGCMLNDTWKSGKVRQFDIHDAVRDRFISVTVAPVKQGGRITHIIHITRDISESKTQERELTRLNSKLFKLYETSAKLQRTADLGKNAQIIMDAFLSLGFDRVRIYLMKQGRLHGFRSSHLEDKLFSQIVLEITKEYPKALEAMQKRKPVIIQETRTRYTEILGKKDLEESAALPLLSASKTIGLISLDNKFSGKKIRPDDLSNLMTFANQAASAIENAMLIEENQRKLEVLGSLYDISSAFASTLDLSKVLSMITVKAVKLLKADTTVIYLLSDKREYLLPHSFFSQNGRIMPLQRILARDEQCLKTGKPHQYKTQNHKTPSMLSVPIMIENNPIGLMRIYARQDRSYNDEDLSTIYSLCNQAAIVIENTKLYDRIRDDKEQLTKLIGFSESINKTLDKQRLLELIMSRSREFTNADSCVLVFSDGTCQSVGEQYHIGRELNISALKAAKPLVMHDPSAHEMPAGVSSVATIPVYVEGNLNGVLYLLSRERDAFKKFRKSLEILANHIEVAVENSRLYEEISGFNEKLKLEIANATKDLREANIELMKMDQLKTDFVSNVSHELRTPLTSIIGYSKLLSHGKLGTLSQSQRHSLKIIEEEGERLTRLINELLDLAKLESGRMKVKVDKMDIVKTAKEALKMLESQARDKGIRLKLSAKHVPKISASSDLMKQVIINLVGNGIKFTEKGRVIVEISKVSRNVVIEVRDTGVGIPKDALPKLFSKFYQVDSSTTRAHSGTGLGLVIVKHIVNQHNGLIEVFSDLGKGSRFRVTLPIDGPDHRD